MTSQIKTVCVCGSGTMGSGIAQVTATAGYATIIFDVDGKALGRSKQKFENDLARMVEKDKIRGHEKEEILSRLYFTSLIEECKADFIIEAIIENIDAKVSLFKQLVAINPDSIFASNTSSLSITSIAEQLANKDRLIGLHFFNPAPLMKLVEVVTTKYITEEIAAEIISFVKNLNKTPVVCKDAPGFIVNRVARPYYIESLRLLEVGKISIETADKILEGQGFKMGPFKLMDLIGNDVNYAVSCSVYDQLGRPERLKPSTIQKEKVANGELGKKTGAGYYNYNSE